MFTVFLFSVVLFTSFTFYFDSDLAKINIWDDFTPSDSIQSRGFRMGSRGTCPFGVRINETQIRLPILITRKVTINVVSVLPLFLFRVSLLLGLVTRGRV